MTWQLLIWNVFVWSFTGIMIYVTGSSLTWLILPAFFTTTQSATELVKQVNEIQKKEEMEDTELDDETKARMRDFLEKFKRGKV